MKGISPLLSYTTLLAVGFLAVALLLVAVSDFSDDIGKRFTKAQVDFIAESIRDNVFKLYNSGSEGKISLPIPENIGNKKYLIEFDQNELKVKVNFKGETIEVQKNLNINVTLTGSSYPPALIEMKKSPDINSIRLIT